MSIAWVFPGQGSQKIGMAEGLLNLEDTKAKFDFASKLLKRDLLDICNNTNESNSSNLNETKNTQPALFVVESLLVDDLIRQGREASLIAGHSLGELVALYAAGVFDFETGLKLMIRRSELMAQADGGAMTAIIGFDRNELEKLIDKTNGVVIANDNSSSQVVISGTPQAVSHISNELNCKRAIQLPVSGAFHSPFMKEAATAFSKDLDQVNFANARFPVLSNTDPTPSTNGKELKERLKQQMIQGVRWRETMESIANAGISTLVEIGPGNVLSGLAKRSLQGVTTNQISNAADLGH